MNRGTIWTTFDTNYTFLKYLVKLNEKGHLTDLNYVENRSGHFVFETGQHKLKITENSITWHRVPLFSVDIIAELFAKPPCEDIGPGKNFPFH